MIITIVSYVLVAVFCLGTGAFLGFVLGRSIRAALPPGSGTEQQSVAREVLRRVQGVTERITQDVNSHSTAVRQVDDRLHEVDVERDGVETIVGLVSELTEKNDVIQRKLADAESKLDHLMEQINAQHVESRTDAVSGCANRAAFDEEFRQRHERFVEHDEPFCLVLLDVDTSSTLIEPHGDDASDETMRIVGRALRRLARAGDFVARYSVREFAVIMPQMTMIQAKHAADAIRQAVATQAVPMAGRAVPLSASLGIVDALPYEESHQLLQRLGATLYAAKKAGGNLVCWHDGTEIHSIGKPPESNQKPPLGPSPNISSDRVEFDDGASAEIRMGTCSGSDAPLPFDADLAQNLPSKTSFCQEVRRRLAEQQRGGATLSVFLVRLNNFEAIAREHGARVAQLALNTLANLVHSSVRDMDTLARYESDSFGVLMPGATREHIRGICDRVERAAEETTISVHNTTVHLDVAATGTTAEETEEMAGLLQRVEKELRHQHGPVGASQ